MLFSVQNSKSENRDRFQHIQISLVTVFHLEQIVFFFLPNLPEKGRKIWFIVNNPAIPKFFTYYKIQLLKKPKRWWAAPRLFQYLSPVGLTDKKYSNVIYIQSRGVDLQTFALVNGTKYSRMDQVKFVEDRL